MDDTIIYIRKNLETLYPTEEIRCITRLILSHICGLSHNQQILCKDKQISENEKLQIYAIVERLKKMEPLQYIIGETEFYSISLNVNASVLIPRPETEELADMIIRSHFSATDATLRILDVGTGSGCIAIALAKNIPHSEVTAIDISDEALITAKNNAILNDVNIRFLKADILNREETSMLMYDEYDIIVSNPPYIKEIEKESMETNVLNYEPHIALFVPDDDPLRFYKAIVDFANEKLAADGVIFFEINAGCDIMTNEMLHEKGFLNTKVVRDLSGKNRFIVATR